jgi:hypothetical protein
MRYLFPSNPLAVLIPFTMIAVILIPSIDPKILGLSIFPFWAVYMVLFVIMKRRQGKAKTTEHF